MDTFIEYLVSALVLLGALFALIGSWGLAKFPDFFRRIHGPTKATTLGVGCMIIGSMVFYAYTKQQLNSQFFLISVFLFITAPASAHIMCKAAIHLGLHQKMKREEPKG